MNLYLTMEQYLSQSLPYFLEHLVEGIKTQTRKHRRASLPLEVTPAPVDENGDKEDTIEVRDRSSGADNSTP